MTLPVAADSTTLLTHRLDALRAERADVLAETRLQNTGDIADRATNVEALIRLQLLDERIASVELEIADSLRREHVDGVVSVGRRRHHRPGPGRRDLPGRLGRAGGRGRRHDHARQPAGPGDRRGRGRRDGQLRAASRRDDERHRPLDGGPAAGQRLRTG